MARAVSRGFQTPDGIAAYVPPLTMTLKNRARLGELEILVFSAIGVERIILHCHTLEPRRCDRYRRVLERAGYRWDGRYEDDYVFRTLTPAPQALVVQHHIPFRRVLVYARPAEDGTGQWWIRLQPWKPLLVLYPLRCYPITVQAVAEAFQIIGEVRTCIQLGHLIIRQHVFQVRLPMGTRYLRVGNTRSPHQWRWAVPPPISSIPNAP